jgi:predicted nucleotidyltransferase
MKNQYLAAIKTLVLQSLAEENVAVALFGSAAVGGDTCASDVDIAVIPRGDWKRWKLSSLRQDLEDLNVPYSVDLVDFSTVSNSFKTTALTSAVWWRK